MYHLTPHLRVQHTAENLGRGLLLCLENKPMSEVTISDLHSVTGVSRATFYRLFDAPEDVLIYLCDRYKQELLADLAARDFLAPTDLFLHPIRFATKNHTLLEALTRNHREDLLDDVHDVTVSFLSERFDLFRDLSPVELHYTQALFHSIMTTTLVLWVQRGRRETPEQLLEYARKYSAALERLLKTA